MNETLDLTLPPIESAEETATPAPPATAEEEIVLTARRRIVLRCGKASLTLHSDGKIVLRGEDILSDAEGVNRLAGGQIELN